MRRKRVLGLLLVSFIVMSVFVSFTAPVSAQQGEVNRQAVVDFIFDTPVISTVFGLVFGLWDKRSLGNLRASWFLAPENTGLSVLIIYLMIWLVLFVGFSDIVSLFAPFSSRIGWIIGAALAIITAQFRFIYQIGSWLAAVLAGLGAFSIFFGIGMAFLAFIALSWGNQKARVWATKRKIAQMQVKAAQGSESAREGLKLLKGLGHDLRIN